MLFGREPTGGEATEETLDYSLVQSLRAGEDFAGFDDIGDAVMQSTNALASSSNSHRDRDLPNSSPYSVPRGMGNPSNGYGTASTSSFNFPTRASSSTLNPILNQPVPTVPPDLGADSGRSGSEDPSASSHYMQDTSEGRSSSFKRKASASVTEGLDEGVGDGPERTKKKRNRAVLSCVPCKARKIKCDRMLPCESCVKRGMTEECRWEDTIKVPPPQTFASASEVAALSRRLKAVEQRLAKFPIDATLQTNSKGEKASVKVMAAPGLGDHEHDDLPDDHDEQQAAVGALEELALGELVLSARPNCELLRQFP